MPEQLTIISTLKPLSTLDIVFFSIRFMKNDPSLGFEKSAVYTSYFLEI